MPSPLKYLVALPLLALLPLLHGCDTCGFNCSDDNDDNEPASLTLSFSDAPLEDLKRRAPEFPAEQLIHDDFFALDQKFDVIVEQTFFCALPPDWRSKYAGKMAELLNPEAVLFGVFFSFPLTEAGPPFGGSLEEYQELFSNAFNLHKLEPCYNSIKPRMGNELFFEFSPK